MICKQKIFILFNKENVIHLKFIDFYDLLDSINNIIDNHEYEWTRLSNLNCTRSKSKFNFDTYFSYEMFNAFKFICCEKNKLSKLFINQHFCKIYAIMYCTCVYIINWWNVYLLKDFYLFINWTNKKILMT